MKAAEAFRTISEVAQELNLPQHVLRFWETRFRQIRPLKRAGGRRFYRPEDVALLRGIRHLLYSEGYTIKGVQKLLKENGAAYVSAIGEAGGSSHVRAEDFRPAPEDAAVADDEALPEDAPSEAPAPAERRDILVELLGELMEARQALEAARR